jgi:hypothetical protein
MALPSFIGVYLPTVDREKSKDEMAYYLWGPAHNICAMKKIFKWRFHYYAEYSKFEVGFVSWGDAREILAEIVDQLLQYWMKTDHSTNQYCRFQYSLLANFSHCSRDLAVGCGIDYLLLNQNPSLVILERKTWDILGLRIKAARRWSFWHRWVILLTQNQEVWRQLMWMIDSLLIWSAIT